MPSLMGAQILKEIEKAMEPIGRALVNGNAKSHEDYWYMVGICRGLKQAGEIVQEIEARYRDDEGE